MQGADKSVDAIPAGSELDLSAISPAFDPVAVMPYFAPEVHIHPSDEYLPASVDWYLERTQLRFHRRFGRDITILDPGSPGTTGLISQNRGQDLSGGLPPTDFYLQIVSGNTGEAVRKGQGVAAECYVHARSVISHPDLFDLQYWFFYPYNGNADRHTGHEGDWEHLTVRVSNILMPEITSVYYSAHSPGQGRWIPGADVPLSPEQRPIAYSARSSHASYAVPGAHVRHRWKPVDYAAVDGPVWDTSATLVMAAINGSPTPGNEWLDFSGRWGKFGRWWWKWAGHGPRGPAHQASWYIE
jgi:hypothetical protein